MRIEYLLLEGGFVHGTRRPHSPTFVCLWARVLALAVSAVLPGTALSSSLPDGAELMQTVADRDRGETRVTDMTLYLTNQGGHTREQDTVTYRKYYGEERRSVIFYKAPSNVRGTAFLTYDYADADQDDDQWLYLPATRKVRRISASNRGDYFLGTDFTYGDIKNENRLPVKDYDFTSRKRDSVDGVDCVLVRAEPVNETVAEELGYSRVRAWVDPERNIIRKARFRDVAGNPLKVLTTQDVRKVDGIWTVHRMKMNNLKTGHKTVLEFSNVRYNEAVNDNTFTQGALRRGRF